MKQSLLILLLSVLSFSFTSCDNKDHITQEDMTENVKIFIERMFPGSKYNKIKHKKNDKAGLNYYEIELIPYLYIEITTGAAWMKVEDPEGLQPRLVNDLITLAPPYVAGDIATIKENHPGSKVKKMVRDVYNNVYIELDSKEIYILHNESQVTSLYIDAATEQFPEKASQFVSEYLTGVAYQSIWKTIDNNNYRVILANGTAINFDKEGNLTVIDGNWDPLPKNIYKALPEQIQNSIDDGISGDADLYRIETGTKAYTLYYEGKNNDTFILSLDPKTGLNVSPSNIVGAFITTHFAPTSSPSYGESTSYNDSKVITYNYTILFDEYSVVMNTSKQGEWKSIEVKDSDTNSKKAIPSSIIKTLPSALEETLSTEHSGRVVWSIEKGDTKITVKADDKVINYNYPI